MKKILLFILFILLFTTICVESLLIIKLQANIDNIRIRILELHSYPRNSEVFDMIDANLLKCTETDATSTKETNNCFDVAISKQNKRIIKSIKKLNKNLDDKYIQKLFIETQEAWENYYKKEKEIILKVIAEDIDIKANSSFAYEDLYILTKQRADNLDMYNRFY